VGLSRQLANAFLGKRAKLIVGIFFEVGVDQRASDNPAFLVVVDPDGLGRNSGCNCEEIVVAIDARRRILLPYWRADHSRLVCRARIVSEVSLKRGRSLRITSSKAIICAVSNREPMGRTESLPL
jgi:hypothetical protein